MASAAPRFMARVQLPTLPLLAVAAVSVVPAAYDVWLIGSIALAQLGGAAHGTDFLNLYSGAALLLRAPSEMYVPEAQLAFQRGLTGWSSPPVPFYLPPHAALLLSWLGLLPYGVAYLVWLVLSVGCLALAAHWIAPRWLGAWSPLAWTLLVLPFLPAVLGLGQGQTAALALVAFAGLARSLTADKPVAWHVALAALGVTLKPQFAPFIVLALVLARQWRALALLTFAVGALSGIAAWLIGQQGLAAYVQLTSGKLNEALTSDPGFLPGPTLLHATQWFLGVNPGSQVVAVTLVGLVAVTFVFVWRAGLARGDAVLLQLALLPVVGLLTAPYALAFELTVWLGSFWLLWRCTRGRPNARAVLVWLTAAAWLAGNVGVVLPLQGGSDIAALLGLALVVWIAWRFHVHVFRERQKVLPSR